MGKIYEKFKAVPRPKSYGVEWSVVTDEEGEEIVIATIPKYLKHQKAIADALAYSLTKTKYGLVDLI